MKRRDFLVAGAAALVVSPSFSVARAAGGGFRTLTARPGTAPLGGAARTPTAIWGYDGAAPGPVLRLRQGREARLRLVNRLTQPTSIHWHGLILPYIMDGVPTVSFDGIDLGSLKDRSKNTNEILKKLKQIEVTAVICFR